ncbi:hypothetical protein ATY41_00025 [Leifsonia xyli subsp. xyli]|uniref:Bacterial Ig-like domain-containing protein n=1 Tax=Leifsonia xyli subsp. xyli TaxID=59736 RepID=A0A1E2SNB7_LEIXY|nr:hypothetical protein ATY41_00025 [Leifsonia xyli subsp. xyli]
MWAFTEPGEYAVSVAAEARFSNADGTQSESATAKPVTYRFEVSALTPAPAQAVSTPVPSTPVPSTAAPSTPAPSASAPGSPTSPRTQALDTAKSSAPGSVPAAKRDAAVVLASSSPSAKAGDSLTLTASVTPVGAAGFVEFTEAEKLLGRIPVDSSTGVASHTVAALTAGSHSYTAQFVPSDLGAYTTASSDPVTVTVHGDRTVLSAGDLRLGPQYVDVIAAATGFGSFRMGVRNVTGWSYGDAPAPWSAAEDTIIHLTDRERDPATGSWSTPQATEDPGAYAQGKAGRLLFGVTGGDTSAVSEKAVISNDTTPSFTLTSVTGPDGGRFSASSVTGDYVEDPPGSGAWTQPVASTWDSSALTAGGAPQTVMENNVTTRASAWNMGWSFTQPGQYCVSVKTVIKSYKPSATRSAQATYTLVVGDKTDPAMVTPCAQVPLSGGGDDGHDSGASRPAIRRCSGRVTLTCARCSIMRVTASRSASNRQRSTTRRTLSSPAPTDRRPLESLTRRWTPV